jgi:hypothetical protein
MAISPSSITLGIDAAFVVAPPAQQRGRYPRGRAALSGSTLTAAQRVMVFTTSSGYRVRELPISRGRIYAYVMPN